MTTLNLEQDNIFGPFVVDEIPEPVKFTFRKPEEQGGGPIDLTSYDVEIDITKPDGSTETKQAEVVEAEEGKVRYVWDSALDQAGDWTLLFWITSGSPATSKLAGVLIGMEVKEAPRHSN